LEAREYEPLVFPAPAVVPSEEERQWDTAMRCWRRARRFRRRAEQVLGGRGISFSRWQVLEATERLIREQDDAVSQRQVARRTELPKSSVSEHLRALSLEGLVDIRPDAWGVFDRIWLTKGGERLIATLRSELVGVARAIVE
jgi:DNA-binding MarR family transcriptional regulator